MKRGLPVLIVCTLLALAVGPTLGADADKDKEKLQGTWESMSFEAAGLAKNSKSVTLDFQGDIVFATIGEEFAKYELALDVDKRPKQIDLIPMLGLIKLPEQVDRGLYTLDGNELTICLGGQRRPVKFELRPESGDSLIKLKRKGK